MQIKTFQPNIFLSLELFLLFVLFFPFYSLLAKENIGIFTEEEMNTFLLKKKLLTANDKKLPLDLSYFINQKGNLFVQPGYHSEIENIYHCFLKENDLCTLLDLKIKQANLVKKGEFYLNQVSLQQFIKEHVSELESLPQEPRLRMGPDKEFVIYKKGAPGTYIEIDKSVEKITTKLKKDPSIEKIELAVDLVPPKISLDNLSQLGIKEKIGHGQSNFSRSPKNRVHNIKVATEKFNGIILEPNEKFSFVSNLGSVDRENGYKEELVIKNNETKPEFGGGICQVSTTLFRSVVNSGFEVVERKNHAYPVSYYSPQGTDATVYIPKPDLVFVNNTNHYVLIQSEFNNTILSFDIYGTNDGRTIELTGPFVTSRNKEAGTMRTVWNQIVKDKDGKIIVKKSFKSFYDNPAKYHKEKKLAKKPKDWSKNEWKKYKKE